ncbi:MAG: diguanylate cyclase [Acidobacteriota bacterium]|nr:diguanylate cyclase [Acidobacteriota bacterium]
MCRPIRGWGALGLCFVTVLLAAMLVNLYGRDAQALNVMWAANGLLLTYLLLVPRWQWGRYILAGFTAMFLGSVLVGDPLRLNLLYNVLNTSEAFLAALLMRPRSAQLPQLTDTKYLLRFILFAVFAAPMLIAVVFALVGSAAGYPRPELLFTEWIAPDALGVAIIAPACIALYRCRFRTKLDWSAIGMQILVAALTAIALRQPEAVLLFFIFPLLMFIVMRYGIGWAAMSLLVLTAIGGTLTVHGHGDFVVISENEPISPNVRFQFYLAAGLCMVYLTAVLMENFIHTQKVLNHSVALHELITTNLSEVVIVNDLDGDCLYTSPASEKLLGTGNEMDACSKTDEPAFPNEQRTLRGAIEKVRAGDECGSMEYQLRRRDGRLVWVEVGLKLLKDPATGAPLGILKILRDIDQRKKQEEQLREAYRALETLATSDPLTHLANRRHFDKFLASEWRRSIRLQEPISVLVLDVDYFKTFNDAYGHLRGDCCLKQVAEATQDVVMRSSDLVARIGGEEFAVVLQNTDVQGASKIAENIRLSVLRRKIRHDGNPLGYVTISIGCSSCVPRTGQLVRDLIDRADQALYAAKRSGRNCIATAATCEHRDSVAIAS